MSQSSREDQTPQFKPVNVWIQKITEPRSSLRTAFRWTLMISLIIHMLFAPLVPKARQGISQADQERLETEYARKVSAAKRARIIAPTLKNKITMPKPPDNPEDVIETTFSEAVATDIEKVVGELLDVPVLSKITKEVTTNLKEELAAAAKKMAAGEFSEKEIEAFHKEIQKRAHEETVKSLKAYRVETQEERSTLSTTEWYEKIVSKSLFSRLSFFLFNPPNYRGWPPSPQKWIHTFPGGGKYPIWAWRKGKYRTFHYSVGYKIKHLDRYIIQGQEEYRDPKTRKRMRRTRLCYANPCQEQAEFILAQLKSTHGSWKGIVYGGQNHHGLLNELYPHKEEAFKARAAKVDAMWKQALDLAEAYNKQAQGGASKDELKEVHGKLFAAMKTLKKGMGSLHPGKYPERELHQVNQAVKLQVLRSDLRDKLYSKWVDRMTEELSPLIQDYARGQFEKGIIAHKKGIENMIESFPKQIVPLLRRDIMKLVPQRRFNGVIMYPFSHTSKVTGNSGPPSDEQFKTDVAAMEKLLEKKPELKTYAEKRRRLMQQYFEDSIENVIEVTMTEIFTGKLLTRAQHSFVEGVDYADKVEEKLSANQAAKKGRGQDLANLTKDGVPDTRAPMVALMLGVPKGTKASLEPVVAPMTPAFMTDGLPLTSMRKTMPRFAPKPTKWGFQTQVAAKTVKPKFKVPSPRFEAIPFLPRFPRLDGDLSDWGKVRPLVLRGPKGKKPIMLYVAWNYQGFFFGYNVDQPDEEFYYPTMYKTSGKVLAYSHNRKIEKQTGIGWAFGGDYLRLFFDTLDARGRIRGEPHAQEFIIWPRGTDTDPDRPGLERVISSKRDATSKRHRRIKDSGNLFTQQPSVEHGPDGTGPFRATRARVRVDREKQGYCTEVFIPRSLFNEPVFAPGWYVGFDCTVQMGYSGLRRSQTWVGAKDGSNRPNSWGDLLLLGTDAYFVVQNADAEYSKTKSVIPGHSYLVTVVDPDRNVSLSVRDTILVSAEVSGGANDVEVYILKETGKNTGIFRGFVNTQPGFGREVQGVLEVMPENEILFGYLDFANARGQRKVINQIRLPVTAAVLRNSMVTKNGHKKEE